MQRRGFLKAFAAIAALPFFSKLGFAKAVPEKKVYPTMTLPVLNSYFKRNEGTWMATSVDPTAIERFNARGAKGAARGEVSHPKMSPGEDVDLWQQRSMVIYENLTSHSLSNLREQNGIYVVDVTPAGPFAEVAYDLLTSGHSALGVRGFQVYGKLVEIVTFDLVTKQEEVVDPNWMEKVLASQEGENRATT